MIRAVNGDEALFQAQEYLPELVILDISMPGLDGIEVCYQLRQQEKFKRTHIAFLTARSEEYVEVAAFEAGANDFITKPIKPRALVARIKSILNRKPGAGFSEALEIHDLAINKETYSVMRGGEEILLSKLEFDLLYFLASHAGKVYSRASLLSQVWDGAMVKDRTVDVHIRKLRRQLGEGYIDTLKGVGYRFKSE
ncbi:UNVERIFIED_CONTAM: hypothetical protein GTU68_065517 [Idotea baltica]|nr:hypothetical protein [Idotea baltica]